MSGSSDHQATIVDKGIRMKIKRRSPPSGEPTETTGSRPVDDVINGKPRMTSLCQSKRKRLKATKINADSLRNGNVGAHAPTAAGSKLPKRKRPSLDCVADKGSRDNRVGVISISRNGSDIGNSKTLHRDPAPDKNASSAAVDGMTLNNGPPNSTTLYQVIFSLSRLVVDNTAHRPWT